MINTDNKKPFTQVTLRMSSSTHPTLPFVLPFYLQLDRHMIRIAQNNEYSPDIRTAAKAGREKLLKYKDPAFKNQYYILATGMIHYCVLRVT